ncbi:MAG: hypoxanthine phosphoribosyltransferase [Bdellovibrionota bacterium]
MDLEKNIQPLLSTKQIEEKIKQMGEALTQAYQGKELVCVCILKGSIVFFSDLIRSIDLPLTIDFLRVSSYGHATVSSGEVRLVQDLSQSIEGKHVLIVEDIVDTGHTISFLQSYLKAKHPKSLALASLLFKPSRTECEVHIDHLGFTIDNHFVVGYGLDAAEKYRNLPYVGILQTNEESS